MQEVLLLLSEKKRIKLDSPEAWAEAVHRLQYTADHDDCSEPKDVVFTAKMFGPIPRYITDPEDNSIPRLQRSFENLARAMTEEECHEE